MYLMFQSGHAATLSVQSLLVNYKSMIGRGGGKMKPLKQPKKAEKVVLDEDIEFKKKMVV